MLTQGEQLILLALDADKGVIRGSRLLHYGLNAAMLSELLGRGLITLRRPDGSAGVTVVEGAELPLGDLMLETVWTSLEHPPAGRAPHPAQCVKDWQHFTLHMYLKTLRKSRVIDWEEPAIRQARYGRFHLLDTDAAAAARASVDRVRTRADPDLRDQDLAGIAVCLGYGTHLYPGLRNRKKRAALVSAVEKQRFAIILRQVLPLIPGTKFSFDSSQDLAMMKGLARGVAFDAHHSGHGGHHHDGGGGFGGHHDGGGGGFGGHH